MYSEIFNIWKNNATADADLIAELNAIADKPEEISDRFYTELEFGTAGLRGVIGAGTNRMNVYTVSKASQALAGYVNSVNDKPSVAIAYDSRIKSDLFAKTAASVLAANGVKVYIYKELMPTPMLSFAVRRLKCDAGIVITASHNPAKYNGYKAYGSDGCQMPPDAAKYIMSLMSKIDCFNDIKTVDFDKALSDGVIEYIEDWLIEEYLDEVEKQSVRDKNVDLSSLKIIYTPLHGTGNKPVRAILKRIGVNDVTIVKEQELPDGNFPTAPYPNPEIKQPFELALDLAKQNGADLLLATDPDADRVGIAVKDGNEYTLVSGNDVGALLLNYILEMRIKNGTLPKNPIAIKTIVTTEVCQKIADDYGCQLINVLTGFKFIGEQIALLEEKNEENRYILGYEESYGYLPGSYVRDKDAVVASMLICEMAAYYKQKGLSLLDQLDLIFKKYGYFLNSQKSFAFEGQSGMETMKQIMNNLHINPPAKIANSAVTIIEDYEKSLKTDLLNGSETKITLPKSNVVAFTLSDSSKVIFRPSGTEPKIKIYICAYDTDKKVASEKLSQLENTVAELLK
ncbi:MAG: phospho-sugar mutase [Acutalibacteraceae bacterium]|nr:phospho-sugar mutase [Acutalibacteraceae bacterium]